MTSMEASGGQVKTLGGIGESGKVWEDQAGSWVLTYSVSRRDGGVVFSTPKTRGYFYPLTLPPPVEQLSHTTTPVSCMPLPPPGLTCLVPGTGKHW